MSLDNAWGREVFAFAIALQNLLWGATQPVTGMLADKYGAPKVIAIGGVLYTLGLTLMAFSHTSWMLSASLGILIGLGLSGTSFSVVFGAVVRAVKPEQRSRAMGITSAVGSFGQFAMLPGSLGLIQNFGWSMALLILALLIAVIIPIGLIMHTEKQGAHPIEVKVTAREALSQAMAHKGFWLLCFGFFVCGFQVVFIATHLPAYLLDRGLGASVSTTALALVGLFNIFGTYYAGVWGGMYRKPILLALIYALRAVAIGAFLLLPLTLWSAYAFGAVIGLLWLSTVPLTNGIVASIFGVQNLAMLSGIVFFFHQVGAFLGSWLGGLLYDRLGSYDAVWLTAIGLSVIAALLNLPIRDTALVKTALTPPILEKM
jgi:MFS family permease